MKIFFKAPSKNKYLVIDSITKQLDAFFEKDKIEYSLIDKIGESLNLYVLLKSLILRPNFNLKKIYKNYLEIYIEETQPEFIFTYQDLNPYLLGLNISRNIKFIIIQNGARYLINNTDVIKGNLPSNFHFLTMYKARSEFLKQKYNANTYTVGSLLSNLVPKNNFIDNKKVVFVSQYKRNFKKNQKFFLYGLTHEQVYQYELKILEILIDLIKNKDLKIYILGRTNYSTNEEYKFYEKYINNKNVFYEPNINNNNEKFKFLDSSRCVVGIDSALLYESLARGKNTFFASCRGFLEYQRSICTFLYPYNKEDYGPNWSNIYSENKIKELLNNFLNNDFEYIDYKKEVPYNPSLNSIHSLIEIIS